MGFLPVVFRPNIINSLLLNLSCLDLVNAVVGKYNSNLTPFTADRITI